MCAPQVIRTVRPRSGVTMNEEQDDSIRTDVPRLPTAIGPASSPLWPRHLVDLFVRPRRFFSTKLALGKTPYVVFVTWCYGVSHAIDRVDTELLRAELGRPRPVWEHLGPLIAESWLGFWSWVLLTGGISALFLWWIGGWWYRVRLRWSGAPDPDKRLARLLLIYSSFVFAGPAVVATLVQTAVFPHYSAAFAAEEWYSLALLIFPFWSIVTSYIGVRTLFEVTRWRAVLWFVALPIAVYIVLFGLVALLFALVGEGAA